MCFTGIPASFTTVISLRQNRKILICLGSWKDGIMHGQGVFYFSLGGLVFGSFLNGKADGLCQLVFPNKDSVTGRWKEGKLHGICVKYFEAHKSWALCEYDSGELLKTMKRGTGKPLYG